MHLYSFTRPTDRYFKLAIEASCHIAVYIVTCSSVDGAGGAVGTGWSCRCGAGTGDTSGAVGASILNGAVEVHRVEVDCYVRDCYS